MSSNHQVELTTEGLRLRPFSPDDAEALYAAVRESLPELGQWLSWCRPDYSIEDTRQFLNSRSEAHQKDVEYSFAITDAQSGQLLGATGINQIEPASKRANLGYWIRTTAARRGVATTATVILARWAFEKLELQRIEIVAATGNRGSQRVAEKVGATRECVARHRLRVHGVPHDAVVYSMLPSDVLGGQPPVILSDSKQPSGR